MLLDINCHLALFVSQGIMLLSPLHFPVAHAQQVLIVNAYNVQVLALAPYVMWAIREFYVTLVPQAILA